MNLIKATACAASILALTPIFAQEYGADESKIATVVYVSSSAGDDSNDGSMKSPLKTFAKIPKENARILLKKGDVFYEPLSGLSNCVVDSYGKGSKYPVICGLKLLKNPDAWEDMGNGVWRLDMNKTENFYGRNLEITKGNYQLNNLGALYDAASDTLYGHKVKKLEMLEKDWDITTGEIYKPEDVNAESYRWLYVKHDKNPSSDGAELGILTYGNGVSGIKNCTVRNIAIKGFGRHGLTGSFGGKIENVKIDLIGGCVYSEILYASIQGIDLYTQSFIGRELVAHSVQLEGDNAASALQRGVIIGIMAERQVQVAIVRNVPSLVDDQVQHVLFVHVVAMIELVHNINMVLRQPDIFHIDAVVSDAVRLVRWHPINVFRQDVFNVLQLCVVFIAGQLLLQQAEVDKGALLILHGIAMDSRRVRRIKAAPVIQLHVIVLPFHHLDRAYGEQQIFVSIAIVIQAGLQGKHRYHDTCHPSARFHQIL